MSRSSSYALDEWTDEGPDFAAMARHAREVGGPALRALTFHDRARMLKSLADAIMSGKEDLYELSFETGATRRDSWADIEGGAGTLFAYASRGRRELPAAHLIVDGQAEVLGKTGAFIGQHVWTPLTGVAVHINAFNFPVWGMLEKLGPALLAGVPAIVKPASATAYLAQRAFRIIIDAAVLPPGSLQLVIGPVGDLMDHLTGQDVVAFTGSAATAGKLRAHRNLIRQSVRFIAEQDSLNAAILGPDATPDTPEFGLFIAEVVKEMTVKAGQKCTAIRRALVPAAMIDAAETALKDSLSAVIVGDSRAEGVTMGPLVSERQGEAVLAAVGELAKCARVVFGDPDRIKVTGAARPSPILLRADDPWAAAAVHEVEAFGPVATLMPYRDLADAIALANRGGGSLVASLYTHDPAIAAEVVLGAGAFHGRLIVIDRDCAAESTGHGSPLPGLVHGGPGRAGGGEEMGGVRGLFHYMQRTALQGSPRTLSAIVERQLPGAPQTHGEIHPFRKRYGELELGYTLNTASRTITLEDIEHFAHFTGDNFYAHMDEEAAKASPIFGGRVAHGYLILSFAAGLFVDPAPGPVLANYGLEELRFVKPMKPGDAMAVALTVKSKAQRSPQMGEVRWGVVVTNQAGEVTATYDLLTMNAV
ncbi:MAG TPA: phenylacetic acid degradation bifunctional protein PaaZ [Caulobacteraceae bacterium]|jgi:oxepin-CoA hydrolase/3-oxo-5,6-dehydrosuberyl-CoA semialdehyde dehydrogenase|nr:phenylacetic acid degradation bifunctional protein PaaZ [Caulobacteraceae bacterium]